MNDLRELVDVAYFVASIHNKNNHKANKNYSICVKYAYFSDIIVKYLPILYFSVIFLYEIPSVLEYFKTGILKPPLGIYFPNVNGPAGGGNGTLIVYNFVVPFFSVSCLCAFDTLILIAFTNVSMVPTIIIRDLDELKNVLKKSNRSVREINCRLIQIILMHKMYNQ